MRVEAEGYDAQLISFRPDTLRRPLTVQLARRTVQLREVVVQSNSGARYRGDTLVISVDSIKTQPHASATDLLNNMAGASVDAGGQVKILGKNVSQVTVEGKPLYGGNPKAALAALNADMIKNLEVTEIPGGEGETSLNIRLKDDRKTGAYGRLDGLLGSSRTFATAGRVSQVRPGRLLSAFVTANNIYEQALTSDDQNALVRNTVLKEAQGGYSVTETALPRTNGTQADRNVQNLVEAPLNVGQVRTVNGGLNYNQSAGKADLFGYVLADHTTQQLQRTFSTTRFLDPFRQQDAGASTDETARTKATAYFNGKWTLSPRQTVAVAGWVGWRQMRTTLHSDLTTILRRDTSTLTQAQLLRRLITQEQQLQTTQQAVWVKRYDRPAEMTSLFIRQSFSARRFEQNFTNQLHQAATDRLFSNRIERRENVHSYEAQAIHAVPLSRKLLLEGKITWSYEASPVRQDGYRLTGNEPIYAPGLSLDRFQVKDQQRTARATLYYKTPRFSALLSPTVWHWTAWRRVSDQDDIIRQQRTAFLPAFFVEYRPDAVTKLSLRYGQTQLLPTVERLFPVPDSANIQFIRVGNPSLVQTFRQTLEANGTSSVGNNKFTLTARYGLDDDPVLTDARTNSLGFLTQTYQQPEVRLTSFATSLLWFQLNQLKAYSLHAFTSAQWQESYLFTQGVPIRLRMFVGLAVAGFKWQGPANTTAKLDWRTTFTQQNTWSAETKPVRNARHEPTLRVEKKWLKTLYTDFNLAALLNSYAQGNSASNLLLDVTVSKFLFAGKRVKLSVSGRNLLNYNYYETNVFAANTQRRETVDRLPRFVLVGLSVYPEKWK